MTAKRNRKSPLNPETASPPAGEQHVIAAETRSTAPTPSRSENRVISRHEITAYRGPVPPPELLREYDQLDPGRAAKLLNLAEDQSRHRMSMEARVIASDLWRAWAGVGCGLLIALFFGGIGAYLVLQGHDVAGASIATSSVIGLVTVFIYGTLSRRQERSLKNRELVAREANGPR